MQPQFKVVAQNDEANAILLAMLRQMWAEYLAGREAFRRKISFGSVHHLRTSVRRLEAMLDLIGVICRSKHEKTLLKQIHGELKSLSDLRDAQVQLRRLKKNGLAWLKSGKFIRHLREIERRESKRASNHIKPSFSEKKYHRLEDDLRGLLGKMSPIEKNAKLEELRQHFEKTVLQLKDQQAKLKLKDGKGFHKLRLAVKNCLYQMEITTPLIVAPDPLKIRIAQLKEELGELQDETALSENARGFFKRTKAFPHPKRQLKRLIHEKRHRARGIAIESSRVKRD